MGRAAALTFAREGASVIGCDVTVEPAEETLKMANPSGAMKVSLQASRVLTFGTRRGTYAVAVRAALAQPWHARWS